MDWYGIIDSLGELDTTTIRKECNETKEKKKDSITTRHTGLGRLASVPMHSFDFADSIAKTMVSLRYICEYTDVMLF